MATSTFSKTIYIDQEAAEKLAALLDEPPPKKIEYDKKFWAENERKVKEWLSRLEK